jgi:hypothetical protein
MPFIRRVLGQCAAGPQRSVSDRCITSSIGSMSPVRSGEVVKGQQGVTILNHGGHPLVVFGSILVCKRRDRRLRRLPGRRLPAGPTWPRAGRTWAPWRARWPTYAQCSATALMPRGRRHLVQRDRQAALFPTPLAPAPNPAPLYAPTPTPRVLEFNVLMDLLLAFDAVTVALALWGLRNCGGVPI